MRSPDNSGPGSVLGRRRSGQLASRPILPLRCLGRGGDLLSKSFFASIAKQYRHRPVRSYGLDWDGEENPLRFPAPDESKLLPQLAGSFAKSVRRAFDRKSLLHGIDLTAAFFMLLRGGHHRRTRHRAFDRFHTVKLRFLRAASPQQDTEPSAIPYREELVGFGL
jgi:hypothetical protein